MRTVLWPRSFSAVQGVADCRVIRIEDLALSGDNVFVRHADVAGDLGSLAERCHEVGGRWRAIAIHDQTRVGLQYCRSIEQPGQLSGHCGGADVPGDVAPEGELAQAEVAELSGKRPSGVLAGEKERR